MATGASKSAASTYLYPRPIRGTAPQAEVLRCGRFRRAGKVAATRADHNADCHPYYACGIRRKGILAHVVAPEDVRKTAQEIRDFVRNGTKLPNHFDMKHAHAAVKAYAGMTLAEFDSYVKTYAAKPANGFTGMTYAESFYKPMLEVFKYLEANGFTYYVVSGSDRFICRALTESIGIAPNRVIGMDVRLQSTSQGTEAGVNYTMGKEEDIVRTDELIIKNLKTNKVLQIAQEIGKVPVLSFGNSGGDCAMHNYCLGNTEHKTLAFMLIADDEARDHANREKALKLGDQWRENGYIVISMRDDFKTIYGYGVEKTDFSF